MLAFLFDNWGRSSWAFTGFFAVFITIIFGCLWLTKHTHQNEDGSTYQTRAVSTKQTILVSILFTVVLYISGAWLAHGDKQYEEQRLQDRGLMEQTFTKELFPDIEWMGTGLNFMTEGCYVVVTVDGDQMRVNISPPYVTNLAVYQPLFTEPNNSVEFVQTHCGPK